MAEPNHASGTKLVVKFGNGASPEVFTAKCTINAARSLSGAAQTNDFNIPDCADPDALSWVASEKSGLRYTVTGAGIVHTNDIEDFHDLLISPDPINMQIVADVPSAVGGVVFEGPFLLTQFDITGDQGAKMEASITLVSNGEVEVSANS